MGDSDTIDMVIFHIDMEYLVTLVWPCRTTCARRTSSRSPRCSGTNCISKQNFKAARHIKVSSAETIDAFNTGVDTVNLHRLTTMPKPGLLSPLATSSPIHSSIELNSPMSS